MRRLVLLWWVSSLVALGAPFVSSTGASADPPPVPTYHFWPISNFVCNSTFDSNFNISCPPVTANVEYPLPDNSIDVVELTPGGDGVATIHRCGTTTPDDAVIALLFAGVPATYTAVNEAGEHHCITATTDANIAINKKAAIGETPPPEIVGNAHLLYYPLPASQVLFDGDVSGSMVVPFTKTSRSDEVLVLRYTVLSASFVGYLQSQGFDFGEQVQFLTTPTTLVTYTRLCVCSPDPNMWSFATTSPAHIRVELLGVFSDIGFYTPDDPGSPLTPPTDRLTVVPGTRPVATASPPQPPTEPPTQPTPPADRVGFESSPLTRVLDTRIGTGGPTHAVVPGEVLTLGLSFVAPADALAAVLNVTAVPPPGGGTEGFVTVFPCDSTPPNVSNLNFRRGRTRANLVTVAVSATNTVCFTASAPVNLIADYAGSYTPGASDGYEPVGPERLIDTRLGVGIANPGKVSPLAPLVVPVTGRADVPETGVSAVTLNVTALDAATGGFVTVYPCGGAVPDVSNVNFTERSVTPNLVTVAIPASGLVCITTSTPVDVLVDLFGFFAPDATNEFIPLEPTRLTDTRFPEPGAAATKLTPYSVLALDFSGTPFPVTAAVLNVTAVDATADGYLTVFPCDAPAIPDVSNVNFTAAQAVPNLVHAPAGADGLVCIASSAPTDVIVDLAGVFTPA